MFNFVNFKVKWKKDGKTISKSIKYRLAPSGSLFIKKIALEDAGRYECSIINANGRSTASAIITVRFVSAKKCRRVSTYLMTFLL